MHNFNMVGDVELPNRRIIKVRLHKSNKGACNWTADIKGCHIPFENYKGYCVQRGEQYRKYRLRIETIKAI